MFEALAKRFKHVLSNIIKHPNTRICTKLPRLPLQFQPGGICNNASCMRKPNMFDKTWPNKPNITKKQTREQKKCLMEFKHDQTSTNTIKQGGQTVKCLITKQCLMMSGLQTYLVRPGLWTHPFLSSTRDIAFQL